MKISLNFLKSHFSLDLPSDIDLIVKKIGAQLGEVEDVVVDLAPIYKDVVVVKIVSFKKIEESDHLNHCLIDDGGVNKLVERNSDGLIEVVCGAANVQQDILVAWLPPSSIVPVTYGNENFSLSVRTMLGHKSNGMLASAKELAISDSHEGILVIDKDASVGDSFADIYDLNDHIIDIENKMFTHRPDCFGLIGVAREIAGIFNKPFKSPEWYLNRTIDQANGNNKSFEISISNEIGQLVPRFTAVCISNISVKPSPIQMQSYLTRMGIRPINNIVDITNMAMLVTGQPLHAYDLGKLQALNSNSKPILTVRNPRASERIELLNGKTIDPKQEAIVIASGNNLVGLGGVMGGLNSEVDSNTKNILLESACFDMYSIRRTSMENGIFSEAVTRFSKGQSPLQNINVLAFSASSIKDIIPGSYVSSNVVDLNKFSEKEISRDSVHPDITINISFINDRLGSQLSAKQIATILTNVEVEVEIISDQQIRVRAPFWRTDIEIREDLVEEVGRLYGYDNIKPVATTRSLYIAHKNDFSELKNKLRNLLKSAGANELLTYTFVSHKLIENANQDKAKAYEVVNSISPELNFYRMSLSPSLLTKVQANIKLGINEFGIYELGSRHLLNVFSRTEPMQPAELHSLGFVYASGQKNKSTAYYKSKTFLNFLLLNFGLSDQIRLIPLNQDNLKIEDNLIEVIKPFDQARSALIVDNSNKQWGILGEYSASVCKSFKLPRLVSGFELDPNIFIQFKANKKYRPVSKYPNVKQDITLRVPHLVKYSDIERLIIDQINLLKPSTSYFDLIPLSIYSPTNDQDKLNYSFRLIIADYQKTLSDEIVNKLLDDVSLQANIKLKAERI